MSFGYCTTVDHVKEEIIGLCFDQGCDKNKFICFICYTQQHSKHQNDCLRFSDVIQMIPNCISILDNMQQQQENKMESMLTLFKKNLKFIQSEKDSLLQLKQQLQNQESQYINREFEKLKQWRNITLNKIAKNNISIFQSKSQVFNYYSIQILLHLDDIKKFEKSLDQFFQIYLKANLIQIKEIEQNVTGSIKIQELKFPTQNYKSENLAIECLTSAIDLIINIIVYQIIYKVDNYQEALNFSNQALKSDPNFDSTTQILLIELSFNIILEKQTIQDNYYSFSFELCIIRKFQNIILYWLSLFIINTNNYSLLLNLGQYEEAADSFDDCLRLDLKIDTVYYHKGFCLFNINIFYLKIQVLQHFDEAIQCYDKALELKVDTEFYLKKGCLILIFCKLQLYQKNLQKLKQCSIFQLKKFNEALDTINQALEKTTKQSYLQLKGAILIVNKKIIQNYINQEIQTKNYNVIWQHLNLIKIHLSQIIMLVQNFVYEQRYEESLKFYEAALQLEQNSPDSLNQKGLTLLIKQYFYYNYQRQIDINKHQNVLILQQNLKRKQNIQQIKLKHQELKNLILILIVLNRQKESLEIYEYIRLKYGE